ncbi:hypothetical protein GBAR_LOCUS30385 [Geodia barretti]|uniref:Uncharacterized protein n=1 Tax=Geodia barretti TaxID=519541 RepID=A0AA35TXF4_GEOBA|nr:hypothetical protein GBAR_LOCUS30385 [Geodia barretti]
MLSPSPTISSLTCHRPRSGHLCTIAPHLHDTRHLTTQALKPPGPRQKEELSKTHSQTDPVSVPCHCPLVPAQFC